jgi:prolyl oligopeptidase
MSTAARWLADEISGKVGGVSWMPDSSGFFYRNLADVSNPYSAQIMYHEVGTHPRQDKLLFEQYKEGPLATTWGPFAYADKQCRWMVLGYYTTTKANDLWVVDLDQWRETGEFTTREIITGEDARSSGPILGDTLYLHTNADAPNARVFAIDLNQDSRMTAHPGAKSLPSARMRCCGASRSPTISSSPGTRSTPRARSACLI